MIEPMAWKERIFTFDLPLGWFPAILARLEGTPSRSASLVRGASDAVLSRRDGERWSVKEHVGHLDDLDELDRARLRGFLGRVPVLPPADMGNRKTYEAGHNATPVGEILDRFRDNREALVRRLEALTEEELLITAEHPRLKTPMRLLDWAYFVAEHDDHHIAHARAILRKRSEEGGGS